MKFLFDLGGVFFDWDPHHFYKDVFNNQEERDNFLNNICSDQWNIQQDAVPAIVIFFLLATIYHFFILI